ncbi:MAG: hypothetical protein PHO89_02145 [Methylacidiphilaceae bacterium]|nr:hypothetical protein [Candidatus Methylacidiphilaceae bacterium]
MDSETDEKDEQWNMARNAQRRFFRALPLGRKLAIAADLAEMVRALQRWRTGPMSLAPSCALARPATDPRSGGAVGTAAPAEGVPGHRPAFRSTRLGVFGHGASSLWAGCLSAVLSAVIAGPLWAEPGGQPSGPSPMPVARVMKFVHLPEIAEEQGPRPKNVWIYGRFTARTAVSDGVFLASVNEGINWPDWEEHFNLIDNPGNYVFRRVVFRTKTPLPTIRKGTKFSIPKDHPARLVEIDRVDGVIARMVLESAPVIESQEGAGRLVKAEDNSTKQTSDGKEPPRRVVYLKQLGSIAKLEGSHPENLWTWGTFSARSDLRDGVFTATPAGVESRRVIEWIAGAVLIYPIVEIPSRIIFYVHRPRKIRNGDRVVVTPKHPAQVRRLFLAGGVLAWLDLDPPLPNEPTLQLGVSGPTPSTPEHSPSPERLATGSP